MPTTHSKLMTAAALSVVLLAGCGGGGDDNNHNGSGGSQGTAMQTVTDVVAYINSLIGTTSDSAEPIDIEGITLAVDNGSESAPLQ
jgi:hypothetical protein